MPIGRRKGFLVGGACMKTVTSPCADRIFIAHGMRLMME